MKLKNLRSVICLLLVVCVFTSLCACVFDNTDDSDSIGNNSSSTAESPDSSSQGGGHTHEYNYVVQTQPTFTDKGLLVGTCTENDCKQTIEVELPVLNYTDYTFETKRESCDEEGEVKFKITVGGQYFSFKVIAPVGHYFNRKPVDLNKVYDLDSPDVKGITILGKEPSCAEEEPSKEVFQCEACGNNYYIMVKKYHKKAEGDEGNVIVEPTCKNEGVKVYKCEYCNGYITETLPKAHNYDYTIAEENEEYILHGKCKGCGEEIQKPAENVNKQVVPATCEKKGTETITCTVDGKTLEFKKELPLTRHKYLGKEVDLDPLPVVILGKDAFCLSGVTPTSCKAEDMVKGIFDCSECGSHFYAMVRLMHTPPAGATGEYECTVCHQTVTGE